MAKKFGKILLGATLVAGAAAAAYWYKKNYLDSKEEDWDDFDDSDFLDDELSDFADYDGTDDFEDEEPKANYVPIKLNREDSDSEKKDAAKESNTEKKGKAAEKSDAADETTATAESDATDDDLEILEEIDDEMLDALAEEALESIQDL